MVRVDQGAPAQIELERVWEALAALEEGQCTPVHVYMPIAWMHAYACIVCMCGQHSQHSALEEEGHIHIHIHIHSTGRGGPTHTVAEGERCAVLQ